MVGFDQQAFWRRELIRGGGRRRPFDRTRSRRRRRETVFDHLEERTVLSTLDVTSGALTYDAANAASALTVSLANSTTVSFTDADQAITLLSGASNVGWSSVGSHTVTGPLGSFMSMAIGGTDAGLSLTLDYASGDPLPASGLEFDPGPASSGSNGLTLGDGSFTSETYTATSAGAGTITYSDSSNSNVPIVFSNLSPVTDTVSSPTFIFNAPSTATKVNIINGPSNTTQVNDDGTSKFELVNFANKTSATVNVTSAGAITTVDTSTASTGLSQLHVNSEGNSETIDVESTPSGVTTTTDTGAGTGSTTNIGNSGSLSTISGGVYAKSTGGSNTLAINGSSDGIANTYTIAGSRVTGSTFPALIDFSGGGITTLDLTGEGDGDTFNFAGPVQSGVTVFNLSDDSGPGPNTLNVASSVADLGYTTPGVLTFGAGEPVINYTNFQTVNVIKQAAPAIGTSTTITAVTGHAFTQAIVATFTTSVTGETPDDFIASINWGDSTPTSGGTIVANGTAGFDVQGGHTYAARRNLYRRSDGDNARHQPVLDHRFGYDDQHLVKRPGKLDPESDRLDGRRHGRTAVRPGRGHPRRREQSALQSSDRTPPVLVATSMTPETLNPHPTIRPRSTGRRNNGIRGRHDYVAGLGSGHRLQRLRHHVYTASGCSA